MQFILYLSLIILNGLALIFGDNEYLRDPNIRTVPPEEPQYTPNGYIITKDRLNYIRSELFYWFFDQDSYGIPGGDYLKFISESNSQIHKDLNFQLPFFGFQFNFTRISINGFLGFSDEPQFYTYPLVFPVRGWPNKKDPSFIGIFFSKCRIGRLNPEDKDQRKPGVYFRLERDLRYRTDPLAVDLRERIKWDIREGIIGADTFDPKHVVITTWKDISFTGGTDSSLNITNSFQIVLATDEIFTYAIFNYKKINWQSPSINGGDVKYGQGGVPAFVGFNAGNGSRSYEYYPLSQTPFLKNSTREGQVNKKSRRHIFRIDEEILPGNCNDDGWHFFSPQSGNMLGGTVVSIAGPCFDEKQEIICHFNTQIVKATFVNSNRAFCIQPFLNVQGYIILKVSVNGKYSRGRTKYFVESPSSINEQIYFNDNSVYQNTTNEILIKWNLKIFTGKLFETTVSISIWGYSEFLDKPRFEYIDIIEYEGKNNGEYRILPGNYRLRDNKQNLDMEFGFVQINSTIFDEYYGFNITRVLWSRPIPLGWYFEPQWKRIHGKQWPETLCEGWLRKDKSLSDFFNVLPLCPCNMDQANFDKGRFLPDPECDKDSNRKCFFNQQAVHCVRSGQNSKHGSEQQCCYDRYGTLMVQYDKMFNGYPKRSHKLGTMPWNETGNVPTLSQWFQDIRPFFSCCYWQNEKAVDCENFRLERRPSQDCVGYQSPSVAAIFGDPHFVTFDNLQYTFNGMGDFVLAKGDNSHEKFEVQGRFEQVAKNIYGEVQATHLTSIATRGNTTTVIEVKLRPPQAQWQYRLDVFADGQRIYFDRPSLKFQHFDGVTVYTPTYILNQSEVIIMYSSGVGIEIVENDGFLTARVYAPNSYINKTSGLFGKWSFDPQDDFTLPNGQIIAVNLNNFEYIHKEFGIKWRLTHREMPGVGVALFTREFGYFTNHISNEDFIPNYIREPENFLNSKRSNDITKANDLCFKSYQCRYDYGMTLNRNMAYFTRRYLDNILDIKKITERNRNSCDRLETPKYGRKLSFNYTPGDRILFACTKGFVLFGDNVRICTNEGKWNVPIHGDTQCLRHVSFIEQFQSKEAIFTSIILIIILCLTGYCIYFYRLRHGSGSISFLNKIKSSDHEKLNEITTSSDEEKEKFKIP